MKHFYLAFWMLVATNTFSQISTEHKSLILKKGATWCIPSGTWGWTAHETIVSENQNKAVILQIFPSSSSLMYSVYSDQLVENFGSTLFTPEWYVNGINNNIMVGGAVNTPATIDNVQASVNATFGTAAVANSEYTMAITDAIPGYKKITVNTHTKFFANVTGEFYLSAYVIENNVTAAQDGYGANAVHSNVLRTSLSSTAFGQLLSNGSIASNTEFNLQFQKTVNANAMDVSDIYIALVIWQKIGATYQYINAENALPTLGTDDLTTSQFRFYPNPATDALTFINNNSDNAEVVFHNSLGQKCLFPINFNGQKVIDISSLSVGLYFITAKINDKIFTYKFIKN
jgi:hypothetical protein